MKWYVLCCCHYYAPQYTTVVPPQGYHVSMSVSIHSSYFGYKAITLIFSSLNYRGLIVWWNGMFTSLLLICTTIYYYPHRATAVSCFHVCLCLSIHHTVVFKSQLISPISYREPCPKWSKVCTYGSQCISLPWFKTRFR